MKRKQGISLIVLIITIIVVIILATAVILSIANNNPIENAKTAKEAHDLATLEEAANLAYTTIYTDKKMNNEKIDYIKINQDIRIELGTQGFSEEECNKVEVSREGVKILNEGVNYNITIPNGFVASKATGETNISTGLVIYEGEEEVTDENVENARKTRNQFVWIPVDDIDEFVRKDGYLNDLLQDYVSMSPVREPYIKEGHDEENNEYNAMYESVKKYHGFYIARYEASKSSEEIAQSIMDKLPWNLIKFGNSMTDLTGGAVGVARNVYPKEKAIKEKDAVSTLCYGVQWDATITFLEKNYSGISSNSIGKGNYNTDKQINTGSNLEYAQNNIYDMCGNLNEWTMEAYSENFRFVRGGNYISGTEKKAISTREIYNLIRW